MATTLLRDALVVDGTGAPAFPGHVLLDGERISAVLPPTGPLPEADRVLDVSGHAVAPGFVDMHSHADYLLPLEGHPDLLSVLLEQGVTTVVAGNCGLSPAPLRPETLDRVKRLAALSVDRPLDWSWRTVGDLLGRFESAAPVVNVAQLVGHSTVRWALGDSERGPLGEDETRACLDASRAALDDGAFGISFGLGYEPAMYSPLEEVEAFARVAADRGKPITVHLKAYSRISPTYPLSDVSPHNLRALSEMLGVARRTGVRLQLSHFIFVGRRSWSSFPDALRLVEDARRDGVDVQIDAFPYAAGNTTIHAPLPYWFLALGDRGYDSRLARARLRAELEAGFRLVGFGYDDFQVMRSGLPDAERLDGRTVSDIARTWGLSRFDALLRLSRESRGAALMLFHGYSGEPGREEPLEAVLSHETCLFETDAVIRAEGWPNPAATGTFPRILGRHVRERRLFGLEDAVRRMTSASCERFGIADRGVVAPGRVADLVVFDPGRIRDAPAGPGRPPGRPEGIAHVFVGGVHAVREGAYVGARAGQVLRA